MKSMVLGLAAAGAIGTAFGICELCVPAASAAVPQRVAAAGARLAPDTVAKKVTLKIEGMTCGGCAISARTVLQRLEGVHKAEVDYEKKQAVVSYDAEKITPQRMIEALKEKLRYTATVIEEKTS